MPLLKKHVGTISYEGDRSVAFAATIAKLRDSRITVLEEDEHASAIVVRFLNCPFNVVLSQ